MTELMKQYEKDTGCSSTTIWRGEIVASGKYIEWLESKLTEQTLEKFLEIIRTQCDEISALKDQLTWRPVSEKPEKGQEVIISYVDCYGNRVLSMGSYVSRFNESAEYDDDSVCEYCEEKDEYYLLEGWYESTNNSEYDSWLLKEKVDMWLPIPPAGEGEC
mgnify:CR=1 FL=1